MKSIKIIACFVLCALVIGLTPQRFTFAVSDDQINQLTSAMAVLGEAIRISPGLTNAERIELFSQLIAVSNLIFEMRRAQQPDTAMSEQSPLLQRAAEVGLESVIMRYEPRSSSLVASVQYHDDQKNIDLAFQYPDFQKISKFKDRMSAVRSQAVRDVSVRTGVVESDIQFRTMITTPYPLRFRVFQYSSDKPTYLIQQNVHDAINELTESFGTYSIINQVHVYPAESAVPGLSMGRSSAKIHLFNDQGDLLELFIRSLNMERFDLTAHFYVLRPGNTFDFTRPNRPETLHLISSTYDNGLTSRQLQSLLQGLFSEIPLTQEIDDHEDKVLSFLLQNSTYVRSDNSYVNFQQRKCYDQADTKIMDNLVRLLVDDIVQQRLLKPDDVKFVAPLQVRDSALGTTCQNVQKVF